jgi:hypothetical protein
MTEIMTPLGSQPAGWYAMNGLQGSSAAPAFEVVGSMVYPSTGHPSGRSPAPWYQLRQQFAYPVDGHPDGSSLKPSFVIRDELVFPACGAGGPPWFRVTT